MQSGCHKCELLMGLMLLPEELRIFLSVTSFEPGHFCLVKAIFGSEFGISSCFTGHSLVAQLLIESRARSPLFPSAVLSFCRLIFTLCLISLCYPSLFTEQKTKKKQKKTNCSRNEDLDCDLHSLLTPELRHACSMVLFCDPYLCVHLRLTVIPAQLASFRQKRAKGDVAGASKKTQKRKGQAVKQIHGTTQDCPVKSDLCQAGDANLNNTNNEVCMQPCRILSNT